MPITKTSYDYTTGASTVETLFADRVLRIETTTETRNWSDTMDYTDFRSTRCVYALVWLGTHGLPPRRQGGLQPSRIDFSGRVHADLEVSSWNADKVRDLEFHEQFGWVDCTNIFSDRNGYSLEAAVDGDYASFGDPLMWANLIAWEGYHAARRAEELKKLAEAAAAQDAIRQAEEAKRVACQTKKDAKEAAGKAEAEAKLAKVPPKGSLATVKGFTGQVFWTGVTRYRGRWDARFGLKDMAGFVAWFAAGDLGE